MALNQINCSYFSILISFGLTRFQAKQFFLTSFNILVQQKLLHRCRYNFQPMLSLLCSMQKCIMRPTYNLLQKNIKTRPNKKQNNSLLKKQIKFNCNLRSNFFASFPWQFAVFAKNKKIIINKKMFNLNNFWRNK